MKNKKAFTLIELSVVLILIGLIISGIIVGKELINQSKLKTVISEYTKYSAAVLAFKDQYVYYPGDMPNASSVIGSTTNGNGDYIITHPNESYAAWQHLILAGLINFGWKTTASEAPASYDYSLYRLESPPYVIYNHPAYSISTIALTGCGSFCTSNNYIVFQTIFAADAYYLDSKIDDGNPSTGKFLATSHNSVTGCIISPNGTYVNSDTYTQTNATYNVQSSTNRCDRLHLILN